MTGWLSWRASNGGEDHSISRRPYYPGDPRGVDAGPNAVLAFAREVYQLNDFDIREMADAVPFPELWRFLRKYTAMAYSELAQSLSKDRFCQALQRFVPDIRPDDLVRGHASFRAQAMNTSGELVNGFIC